MLTRIDRGDVEAWKNENDEIDGAEREEAARLNTNRCSSGIKTKIKAQNIGTEDVRPEHNDIWFFRVDIGIVHGSQSK